MPLLKRKQFPLIDPPPLDLKNKSSRNSPVWYCSLTHEIFDDYSYYLERTTFYRRKIWQCELTGRSNLTYAEALESERLQNQTVQNKLPLELQKAILERAQFQTARLIDVVDDVYNYFVARFVLDEQVDCLWDDNLYYSAIVLEAPPLEDQSSDQVEYKIQLVDQDFKGLADYTRTVRRNELRRDRLAFSKSLLKKFMREATIKDAYLGAPWIINDQFAERFHINTTLPQHLEAAKILAYSKSRKLRSLIPPEKRQEQQQQIGSSDRPNTSSTPTAESRLEEAIKFEAALKYPMEDLDLPIYRRNPPTKNSTVFLDMSLGSGNELKTVPNPTGDWALRPTPSHETMPPDCFGSFLMVWNFLSVFSRPLHLSPFSLNDFESALYYSSIDHQTDDLIVEVIATLLNCIIQHRLKPSYQHSSVILPSTITSASGYIHAPLMASQQHNGITEALNGTSDKVNDTDSGDRILDEKKGHTNGYTQQHDRTTEATPDVDISQYQQNTERGCGGTEVIAIGTHWDAKPIPAGTPRQGWIDILIGCINDLAIELNEEMATFDRILCSLVPRLGSSLEERQRAFLQLDLKDKLLIFKLLTNAANESPDIKDYMEECQEQLTELRKLKIEANRDRKRILIERSELEKRFEDISNDTPDGEVDGGSDSDSTGDTTTGFYFYSGGADMGASPVSKQISRQAMLKRKQLELDEREAKRKKRHYQQQQLERERKQELRIRNMAQKKLDNEEHQVQKKLEHVDRDMRKYSTLRLKPLGRDRFYNRYYYLDNIGGGCTHGSGKLFVQSPCPSDLAALLMNDDNGDDDDETPSSDKTTVASLCGHGGGLAFMCQLMEHQGLADKAAMLEKDIDRMTDGGGDPLEWWESFDDAKRLDDLLTWLNPKGVRESQLKRELQRHLPGLLAGIKKNQMEQQMEASRRNIRSKATAQPSLSSWQSYVNKLAR